ncbi:Bax inhibitor-1/YccA family protein [Brachybacterium sp. EE-P12]|uniref:Bax inhibitor-1/YccA family protein n=1 Tax=Candidatus Brachybacterium intestinipullorum TaxID=2838512 RepID=A0A9D2Q0Z5_9MICO|nr:Bax inhibitor-1/YccA family protein [Brachybacterium sp. EE-P12]HJC70859.1 Bax inhibitor-1/YccA family protein [Candidatus Brachybacterium intestinipullorum]
MARHNIVFGRDQAVQQGGSAYSGPRFGQAAQTGPAPDTQWSSGFGQQGGDQLEAMYARPAATGHDTGRMTMRDALNAITATLGVIIVVGFAVAMTPLALGLVAGEAGLQAGLALAGVATLVGVIGGLVASLVNIFKKQPSTIAVLVYAVFEGLFLGGISGTMEYIYPGIALQAVIGTLAVAGTVLVLFHLGILRTSPALTKIFLVAMVAYLIFGIVNIGYLLLTGTSLREGVVGLIIGGLAVVMASYSLVMDFEDVQRSAQAGVPRKYAWRLAFGIAVTMVWLYVEVLRILMILRGSD